MELNQVTLNIVNDEILWEDLVGYSSDNIGYKVLCIGYNKERQILQIAEYHNGIATTNEISTFDPVKCMDLLKSFGIEIQLKEIFIFSSATITKMEGLKQAGFSEIIYDPNTKKYMIDNLFELGFLQPYELDYLNVRRSKNVILIEDIIKNNI